MEIITINKKNDIIAFTRGDIMRVVISAGGTGGHIYPALAIINKIKKEEPSSEFLYIGTHNRMEKDLIPELKIPYEAIEVTGFKRKLTLDNFKALTNFFKARRRCLKLIKEFNPDIVIGAGAWCNPQSATFGTEPFGCLASVDGAGCSNGCLLRLVVCLVYEERGTIQVNNVPI